MKIISGGQTGVDRAALDVAIERGMEWGGWCPKDGWAEDHTRPPGLLGPYPNLKQTPLPNPAQRTDWNVRDSDAALIIVDSKGLSASIGSQRAHQSVRQHRKPELVIEVCDATAPDRAADWLRVQRKRFGAEMILSIGGPRESEAPGIYAKARQLLASVLDGAD
jgi:hypothetical protein